MNALKGAVVALLSSFVLVWIFAYTFRIPIPFAGMLGPFGSLSPYATPIAEVLQAVAIAWMVYGMFGGFLMVLMVGAIAGHWAGRRYAHAPGKQRMIAIYAIVAGALPVTGLAMLDFVIGPW